jgi:Zn-dependent protease
VSSFEIVSIVAEVLACVCAIVFHEFMHGFAAYRLGDRTAKESGRLSFNPIAHIDPFGTIILPALLILIGGPIFGYAKPVPYNPANFKNPRRDELIVGLAGPFGNLALAFVGMLLLFAYTVAGGGGLITGAGGLSLLNYGISAFLSLLILVNLYLMFFNLIPVPPLDGSSIFALLVPEEHLSTYYAIERYALPIFLLVVFFLPQIIGFDLIGMYLSATAGNLYHLMVGWF